ncbi:MAG TPA: hypothetical protein VMU34_04025 [Mycobacterium sp.]|nr:hypothetical protein [Mycobacterium sp.]
MPKPIRSLYYTRACEGWPRRDRAQNRDAAQQGDLRADRWQLVSAPGDNVPAFLAELGGSHAGRRDVARVDDVRTDPWNGRDHDVSHR